MNNATYNETGRISRRFQPTWAAAICHPVALAAVFVMAVNDHWLKFAHILPRGVTGKLSDVVGVFFFPLLLAAFYYGGTAVIGREPIPRRAVHTIFCVLTTLGFVMVNLSSAWNTWMASFWMYKVMDPTDLLVLPVLIASWMLLEKSYAK